MVVQCRRRGFYLIITTEEWVNLKRFTPSPCPQYIHLCKLNVGFKRHHTSLSTNSTSLSSSLLSVIKVGQVHFCVVVPEIIISVLFWSSCSSCTTTQFEWQSVLNIRFDGLIKGPCVGIKRSFSASQIHM